MGILDITDNFCKPITEAKLMGEWQGKTGNKLHEQPLVTFVEKNEEEEVIYREEV